MSTRTTPKHHHPTLWTPEARAPCASQLAFVRLAGNEEQQPIYWPAFVYPTIGQVMEERHQDLPPETKTRLVMKCIDTMNQAPIAELLGVHEWVDCQDATIDLHLHLSKVFGDNSETRLGPELYQNWKKALQEMRRVLAQDSAAVLHPTNLFRKAGTLAITKNASLVHKRPQDSTRIWGQEQPTKKRKSTPHNMTSAVVETTTKTKNKSASSSSTQVENFYIWKVLWSHLQQDGWCYVKSRNPLHDWYYVKPNANVKTGTLGQDYFASTTHVIQWAQSVNYHTKHIPGDQDSVTQTCSTSNTTANKPQYTFAQIWPKLRDEGWKVKDARTYHKNATAAWYWIRPNVNVASGVVGKDYFSTPQQVMEWVLETGYADKFFCHTVGTPSENRTKPQDPSKPLLEDQDPSQQESVDPWDFKHLWPRLKQFGWTWVKARNPLHDYYYVRPGKSVETGTLDQDYFLTEADVVNYEKKQEGIAIMEKDTSTSRRITLSPATKKLDSKQPPKKLDSKQPHKKKVKKEQHVKQIPKPVARTEWWQLEKIPSFTTDENIWRILRDKLEFRYSNGCYCLPKDVRVYADSKQLPHSFAIDHDLRSFLCQHGIPNYDESKLTDEERLDLDRWTKFANVPVKDTTSIKKLQDLTVLPDTDAIKLLQKIQFQSLDTGSFYHAGLDQTFGSLQEVRLACRGMPDLHVTQERRRTKKDLSLSDHEVLELRLWAAVAPEPLPVFGKEEHIHQ
jgi:hypothetical protein